jgi:hypothetical protein
MLAIAVVKGEIMDISGSAEEVAKIPLKVDPIPA